jgi:hypothetical protein
MELGFSVQQPDPSRRAAMRTGMSVAARVGDDHRPRRQGKDLDTGRVGTLSQPSPREIENSARRSRQGTRDRSRAGRDSGPIDGKYRATLHSALSDRWSAAAHGLRRPRAPCPSRADDRSDRGASSEVGLPHFQSTSPCFGSLRQGGCPSGNAHRPLRRPCPSSARARSCR